MTVEEIVAKARDHGNSVREADDDEAERSLARLRWILFRDSLDSEDRRLAVDAYYAAYTI